MGRIVVSLSALFFSLALLVAGSSLLGTLLSVRLSLEGFQPLQIGAVLAFHSIGFVLGTRLVTPLLARVGHVRVFAAFAALACAASLVHPIVISGVVWALLRVLFGFCAAAMIMVLEGWICAGASASTRTSLLAIYQVVYFSALAGGQYLLAAGNPAAPLVFSLAAILLVLSLVPLALTHAHAPLMDSFDRLSFRQLWALTPSGLAGAFVSGMAASMFLFLGPLYAVATGMAFDSVALYMTLAVLATMALQLPLGRLSDIFDRRHVLAWIAAVAAIGAAAAAVFGADMPWVLYAATALTFGIIGCLYPISLAATNDHIELGNPLGASASLLFVYGLGTCVGPPAGALLMQVLGPSGLFIGLAAVLIALAIFVAARIRITAVLPAARQGQYINVAAGTAPCLLALDPRTDPQVD